MSVMLLAVLPLFVAGSVPALADGHCPAKPLPSPSGKYAVGSVVLPVQKLNGTGTSRQVQLWYPVQPRTKGNRAHYVPDPQVIRVLHSVRFLDQADCVFDVWQSMLLTTMANAPITSGQFPFVIVAPGAGMPRFSYTYYAEQLAADGYVVATVDFGEGGALVRDGKLLAEGPVINNETDYDKYAHEMALHISGLLDDLAFKSAPREPSLVRNIAEHIDRSRIAAIGHSLGGAASLNACQADPRITACVDMDGAVQNPVAAQGIKTSALVLLSKPEYTDEELIKKGSDPVKWKAQGATRLAGLAHLVSQPGPDAWIISVRRTGHLSFSDAPYTMQTTLTRFGGRYLDPQRTLTITTIIIEGYLKHAFNNAPFSVDSIPEASVQVLRKGGRPAKNVNKHGIGP
jgi:dienelactone hydrolase